MNELARHARTQPAPPHVVFEALSQPDRDPARRWLALEPDERLPIIDPIVHGRVVTWTALWRARPDAEIRFELTLHRGGTTLLWILTVDDRPITPAAVGQMRTRIDQLINGNLRATFGQ